MPQRSPRQERQARLSRLIRRWQMERKQVFMSNAADILFCIRDPDTIVLELQVMVAEMAHAPVFLDIPGLVADVVAVYAGEYPGYRRCVTGYHDLAHTLDVALATARLLHGMWISGMVFSGLDTECALAAALFHDIGFIQEEWDTGGTGAKYAKIHVQRGVEFSDKYLAGREGAQYARRCAEIIRFTDLTPGRRPEPGDEATSLMGKALASADLMAQMGDPEYLCKLPLLYAEFVEGGVGGFANEYEMVRKTLDFAEFVQTRLRRTLENLAPLVRHHFRVRWQVDEDLYAVYFDENMRRLAGILRRYGPDYRLALQRDCPC